MVAVGPLRSDGMVEVVPDVLRSVEVVPDVLRSDGMVDVVPDDDGELRSDGVVEVVPDEVLRSDGDVFTPAGGCDCG